MKAIIENLLKDYPVLFRFASKVYHKMNGGFKTLSEGTPEAILKAYKLVQENKQSPVGDYYEFGLFRGYAFLKSFEYSKQLGIDNISYYGFDSFEGLPETHGIDKTDNIFFEGQFACSKEDVEANLAKNGMDMSRTQLIKGFYSDSLTTELRAQHDFKPASVILLDCDLYSSTIEALDWVEAYFQDGTVLLFDDWFSFGDKTDLGQPKAMQDFLDKHPEYTTTHLWKFSRNGNAFIVNKA